MEFREDKEVYTESGEEAVISDIPEGSLIALVDGKLQEIDWADSSGYEDVYLLLSKWSEYELMKTDMFRDWFSQRNKQKGYYLYPLKGIPRHLHYDVAFLATLMIDDYRVSGHEADDDDWELAIVYLSKHFKSRDILRKSIRYINTDTRIKPVLKFWFKLSVMSDEAWEWATSQEVEYSPGFEVNGSPTVILGYHHHLPTKLETFQLLFGATPSEIIERFL